MLEFIFFHKEPVKQFQHYLSSKKIPYINGLEYQASIDEEGFTISISENYELGTIAEVEDYYDDMMELNENLISAQEDNEEIKTAGISVNLSDGSTVLANVDPNLIFKLSEALEPLEILQLVSAIADAVENPDKRPLCKR